MLINSSYTINNDKYDIELTVDNDVISYFDKDLMIIIENEFVKIFDLDYEQFVNNKTISKAAYTLYIKYILRKINNFVVCCGSDSLLKDIRYISEGEIQIDLTDALVNVMF